MGIRPRTIGFLVACFGLLLGLAAASLLPRRALSFVPWILIAPVWFGVLTAIGILGRWTRDLVGRWVILGTGVALFGVLWGIGSRMLIEPGSLPYGSTVQLTGVIVSFPEIVGRRQEFVIQTTSLSRPVRLLVTTGREPIARRGSTLELAGELRALANTPEFPEQSIYEGRGIFGRLAYPDRWQEVSPPDRLWTAVNGLRDRMAVAIRLALPEPAASLALGLSLGIDPEIDRAFADDLKRTNLTHLAAVSGQNLAFTVLLVFTAFKRRSLPGAIGAALVVLLAYVILTGAAASVVRAALMTGLFFVGRLIGRPSDGLRLLLVAIVLFALADPLALTHDVGFGLSVFALAGIILFEPIISARLHFLPSLPRAWMSVTTSASLAVLPLQMATFQTVSLVGIPANVVVSPIIALAMGGSLLFGLIGAASPILGSLILAALYSPLELIHRVTTGFGNLATAQAAVPLTASLRVTVLAVGVIVLVVLVGRRILNPWHPVREGESPWR